MNTIERAAEVIRGHAEPTPPGTPDWALWQACALEAKGLLVTDAAFEVLDAAIWWQTERLQGHIDRLDDAVLGYLAEQVKGCPDGW